MLKVNCIIFVAGLVNILPVAEVCERGTYKLNNKCYEPKFERPTTFAIASNICNENDRKLAVSNEKTSEFLYRMALKTTYDNFWVGHFNDCYAIKHENEFIPEKDSCEENFFYICELNFTQWPSSTTWKWRNKYLELWMNRTTNENAAQSCSNRGGKLADVDIDEKRLFVEKRIYENNWWIDIETSTLKELHGIDQTLWAGIIRYEKCSECWEDSQGTIVNSKETIKTESCTINSNGYIEFSDCDNNCNFFCEYFPTEIDTESSTQVELQTSESTTGIVSGTTNFIPLKTTQNIVAPVPTRNSIEIEAENTNRYLISSAIPDSANFNETSQFGIITDNYGTNEYSENDKLEIDETDIFEVESKFETGKPEKDEPETDEYERNKPEMEKSENDKPGTDKPDDSGKLKLLYYTSILVPIGCIIFLLILVVLFTVKRYRKPALGDMRHRNENENDYENQGLV